MTVDYQQTVQNAFREVHDALVTNRSAAEVLAAESARREQLRQALAVATLRYDAGRTSFLEVLDAQRTLLAAETLRIAAARDARLSIVDFAKSLGGGWSPERSPSRTDASVTAHCPDARPTGSTAAPGCAGSRAPAAPRSRSPERPCSGDHSVQRPGRRQSGRLDY